MAANPLGPQPVQPVAPLQHAQFQPSATEQMGSQLLSAGVSKGATHLGNAMFPAAAQTAATGAAATGAAATGAAATGAAATGAAATGAAATGAAAAGAGAAGAGGMAGMLGGLGAGAGAAGAGLMAAAAPVAVPLAIGAGLGKLFGLFNQGGRVPEETMTAMAPQQQAPQQQTPLSFKQLEQQQSLTLKKSAFDADERRKEEAHRIKMAQQQIKLSEAAGLRTPLSAP